MKNLTMKVDAYTFETKAVVRRKLKSFNFSNTHEEEVFTEILADGIWIKEGPELPDLLRVNPATLRFKNPMEDELYWVVTDDEGIYNEDYFNSLDWEVVDGTHQVLDIDFDELHY